MGRKMKAGQTLYGDEVGGAIVPEDEGDLLLKLAREARTKPTSPTCNRCSPKTAVLNVPPSLR